jgi:hypothetical protein
MPDDYDGMLEKKEEKIYTFSKRDIFSVALAFFYSAVIKTYFPSRIKKSLNLNLDWIAFSP